MAARVRRRWDDGDRAVRGGNNLQGAVGQRPAVQPAPVVHPDDEHGGFLGRFRECLTGAAVPELDLNVDVGGLRTGAVLRLLQQVHRRFPYDFPVLDVRGHPTVIHGMNGDDRQLEV